MINPDNINEGDFVTYSEELGYSPKQRESAMQVMELWENAMTVKLGENGCITRPYNHFDLVESVGEFKKVWRHNGFEDNRRLLKIKVSELLPDHYVKISEPSYNGRGSHNVNQLEDIISDYKELVHQLRVREQSILDKFGITIV